MMCLKVIAIVAAALAGQVMTFQVIDRNSDTYFCYITDPITIIRGNVTLKCNELIVKRVQWLLEDRECSVPLATCEDNAVHLYSPFSADKAVVYESMFVLYDYADYFVSHIRTIGLIISSICPGSNLSPFGEPIIGRHLLRHPMEVVTPGKKF